MHPYAADLISSLKSNADPSAAPKMEAYMKDQFVFMGLTAPARKSTLSAFVKANGLMPEENEDAIMFDLWNAGPREVKYAAQELWQRRSKKRSKLEDVQLIEMISSIDPWWDTIDFIASNLAGPYFKKFPEQIVPITGRWIEDESMWLNRVAILFQLKYKDSIDQPLMFKYCERWMHSTEFFHRKAIGWILRELSKTSPQATIDFVETHPELSGLSKREALKHL